MEEKRNYIVKNPITNKKSADKILSEVDGIFKDIDLEYFLLFGTVLGFYRDNGYIIGDDDIDIGIKIYNSEYIKKIIFSFMQHGFQLIQARGFDPLNLFKYGMDNTRWLTMQMHLLISARGMVFLSFFKKGTKIDLFFCYKDDKVNRYIVGDKRSTPIKYLENFEDLEYNGIKFKVPSPVEDYLRSMYGEDWNIPLRKNK